MLDTIQQVNYCETCCIVTLYYFLIRLSLPRRCNSTIALFADDVGGAPGFTSYRRHRTDRGGLRMPHRYHNRRSKTERRCATTYTKGQLNDKLRRKGMRET